MLKNVHNILATSNFQDVIEMGNFTVENGIIKEELIISDNSDIEVTLDEYSDLKSDVSNRSDTSKEILVVNLSDSSGDETVSDAIINQIINVDDTNKSSIFKVSPDHEIIIENAKEDDLSNSSQSCIRNTLLNLDSDEEYIVFDFSDLSAEDILRAAENDKLIDKKMLSNISDYQNCDSSEILNQNIDISNLDKKCNPEKERNISKKLSTSSLERSAEIVNEVLNKCLGISNPLLSMACKNCGDSKYLNNSKTHLNCQKCEIKLMYKCTTCCNLFRSLSIACRHLATHKEIKQKLDNKYEFVKTWKYKCFKCGAFYKLKHYLDKHVANCRNYQIINCPEITDSEDEIKNYKLENHSKEFELNHSEIRIQDTERNSTDLIASNKRKAHCPDCRKDWLLTNLENECLQCHKELIYACGDSKCEQVYSTQEKFLHHLELEHSAKSSQDPDLGSSAAYPCYNCSYMGTSITELVHHVRTLHTLKQTKPYKCLACNKSFRQFRWLKIHKQQYCDKFLEQFKCAHCRYKSFNKKRLRIHLRCAHINIYTGKLLSCPKCQIKCSSIYRLNNHIGVCSSNYQTERQKQKRCKQV